MPETILEVNHVKKYFPITSGLFKRTVGHVKAVDDISFSIHKGETLGIVGESGSGKSTLGRVVLRLLQATEGEICFKGEDITSHSQRKLKPYRESMQMVFQDPFGSLNPKMSVKELIEEPLIVQTKLSREERRKKAEALIVKVGLRKSDLQKYPHEFSGGQRQRISIARTLITDPDFIVCDEPVSALDVSIQAQVLNLMKDLQEELGLTYLFISHDLNVVNHMSDRVAVMYLGKIVELASKEQLYQNPLHPYTKSLLQAIPSIENDQANKESLSGDIPNPANPPSGCSFRTRCPLAHEKCAEHEPALVEVEPQHYVACHLINDQGKGREDEIQ